MASQIPGPQHPQRPAANSAGNNPQIAVAENHWLECIREWYPNLHSQTYFLPPLYFNRVPYDVQNVAGQSVLVPQVPANQPQVTPVWFPPTGPPAHRTNPHLASLVWPVQPVPPGPLPVVYMSSVVEDRSMQQVLQYIRELADRDKEVMLVLSQLDFRKYLDSHVDPINAAAIRLLPRPDTLGPAYKKGDFDLLVISEQYGLIVGEVKAVGYDPSKISDIDKVVATRIKKAVQQLNKAADLLIHLVSDLASTRITKTLMLPNVTSQQLLSALSTDKQAEMDLMQCLNVSNSATAVSHCLCADSLICSGFWQRAVQGRGPDVNMTPELYERLVARFCGPATTIDLPVVTRPRRNVGLRAVAEAVADTGLIMATLTLYLEQVDLVNNPGLQKVFLRGPPGTGKTVVLVLKGIQWCHQGKHINLLSTHKNSRAAMFLIQRQLQYTLSSASPPVAGSRVSTHLYDFANKQVDVDAAVQHLASLARGGELFVIADEAFSGRKMFSKFCTSLAARVPSLHLWAAGMLSTSTCPLQEEILTTPLRCPPAVIAEIEGSELIQDRNVPQYTSSAAPVPTVGPAVKRLPHRQSRYDGTPLPGHPPDHSKGPPENCGRCGDAIANLLKEYEVDQPGHPLQYRDTVILCDDPRDDLPVVTNLRARGLPVKVVTPNDDDASIRDVALAAHDVIIVTDCNVFVGLERRVVVVMMRNDPSQKLLVVKGARSDCKLHGNSRSTSLLVTVDNPL